MTSKRPGVGLLLACMALAGAAARAGDPSRKEGGDLAPGSPFASDGAVLEALKAGDTQLKVTFGKHATGLLNLAGTFPVRFDRYVRRGGDGPSIFRSGRKIAVLGRDFVAASDPYHRGLPTEPRIAPYHAVVVGEGFEPKSVLKAAHEKFGDKAKWFAGTVDRFTAPDHVFVQVTGLGVRAITVAADDRVLMTTVYDSEAFARGEIRSAFKKGDPIRVAGGIETVLYLDAKGQIVSDAERKKPGIREEIHLAPKTLALLDPTYPYAFIENAQEGAGK